MKTTTLLVTGLLAAVTPLVPSPATAATPVVVSSSSPITIGDDQEIRFGAGFQVLDATGAGPTAASPYGTPVSVADTAGTVVDVDVDIVLLDHSHPRDVDLMLVSPAGTRVMLMSDVGGTVPFAGSFTLDDEAAAPISDAAAPGSTTNQPTDLDAPGFEDVFPAPAPTAAGAGHSLSAFDGEDPRGQWRLFAVDDAQQDVGSIYQWHLKLRTTGSAPYPSAITVTGARSGMGHLVVRLDGLTHGDLGDLDVLLVGPRGQQVLLMSDNGGYTVKNASLIFDDRATETISSNGLTAGPYRPHNSNIGDPDTFPEPAPAQDGNLLLSVFDGTDPNGTWQLFVHDDQSTASGRLGSWSLAFDTPDRPSSPVVTAPSNGQVVGPDVVVSGVAPAGSTVRLVAGDRTSAPVATTPAGTWSVPVEGLAPGPHTLVAVAFDAFGNSSLPSAPVSVSVPRVDAPAADTTGPRVTSIQPQARAAGIRRGATVTATLSEPVTTASVTRRSAYLVPKGSTRRVRASVRYVGGTVVIDPRRKLREHTTYRVVLTSGIRDLAGNALVRTSWRFTTR